MNVLVILAHPNPDSFNHAIVKTLKTNLVARGHDVIVRDLYKMNFHPVLEKRDFDCLHKNEIPEEIQLEHELLEGADLVFFVHPTWWMGMPAILKGYIDRVMFYMFSRKDPLYQGGHLKGKYAYVIQTTGAQEKTLQSAHLVDSMQFIQDVGILEFIGFKVLDHKFFFDPTTASEGTRESMLLEVKEACHQIADALVGTA